jgi:hypothetical protein
VVTERDVLARYALIYDLPHHDFLIAGPCDDRWDVPKG